jgi:hypothetical protein
MTTSPAGYSRTLTHVSPTHPCSDRIVNGVEADVADYPYLVNLRRAGDGSGRWCGGTLIRPDVVLTAAHCVAFGSNFNPDDPFGGVSIANVTLPLVLPVGFDLDVAGGFRPSRDPGKAQRSLTYRTSLDWSVGGGRPVSRGRPTRARRPAR